MLAPAQVMARLESIDHDLSVRQNEYEQAAEDAVRLKRDLALREARALIVADGKNVAEREAQALIAVAAAEDGLYGKYTEAEARLAGMRSVMSVLEHRASIGMALLKAHGRAGS